MGRSKGSARRPSREPAPGSAAPVLAPAARRRRASRFAALFDDAAFGVVVLGPDGLVEYVNRRQCEISRLSREYFLGKSYRATFGPQLERAGIAAAFDRLAADGTPFEVTLLDYERHADAEKITVSLRGHRAGRHLVLVNTLETALAAQHARYRQVFENANDGIFVLSRDGRFLEANARFAELTGLPLERILGQTTEIFLPGRFDASLARLEAILERGQLGPYELQIQTPSGPRFLSLNGFSLLEHGRPVGVINIARDTTEEHRQAEELRQARDQALAASRLKSAFLANMSHEIRTPLNVILGYAELLEERLGTAAPEDREAFEAIARAGVRLTQTVNHVLDISRIETGGFELNPVRIELAAVVLRCVSEIAVLAGRKGLTLDCELEERAAVVRFDEYCLEQTLLNLLSNAVKFTERGGVTVRLVREGPERLRLTVADTGVGIAPEYQPRLFEAFSQEDAGLTRRFEGSGLGLALVKRYVEMNGATVSLESEKGRGSRFHLHLRG